jgi:RsiW-degrading membrane proteinase PrsW (M82 family)
LSWPVLIAGVLSIPILGFAVVLSPLSVVLALVPFAIVLPTLAWIDRVEPEPRQARVHAILWGATVSVLVAGTINSIVAVTVSEAAAAVVSAPVFEELMKGLGVWMAFRRREIDGVTDGLVYAGWVGIGFAVMEDVQYFLVAADDGTLASTFVLRALITPFAHPLFTAWIGLAIGMAVAAGKPVLGRAVVGYVVAVLLHAAWNGSLTAAAEVGGWLILVAFAVFVAIFVGTIVMIVSMRRREQRRFVTEVPIVAPRYGITAEQGMVFTDWHTMLRTRRSLPRSERRRFDRRHAALARLVALHQRPGGPSIEDEQRLLAAWHDTFAIEGTARR